MVELKVPIKPPPRTFAYGCIGWVDKEERVSFMRKLLNSLDTIFLPELKSIDN